MNYIKKQDLMRNILIAGACLLVIWPFLFASGSVSAIEVLPKDPITFEQDPSREGNNKLNTRVSSNGQGYLCIWEEKSGATGRDILGQRVDPNGSLQGGIIPISQSNGDQTNPDIDSDGNSYLVVWSDGRDPNTTGSDIYAVLVSSDGTISGEILIETDSGGQKFPKVKWNGKHYLVAWEDRQGNVPPVKVSIYGKRIDSSGQVIDQEPVEIDVDSAYNSGKRVSFDLASLEDPNTTSWLIMWNGSLQDPSVNGFDILGRVLDEDPNDGLSSSPFPIQLPFPTDQYHPSVEGLGNGFLLVWENWTDKEGRDKNILGIRLGARGNILGGLINISSAPDKQTFPEAASNGQGYFVIWLDRRDSKTDHVYGTRVSPEGLVLSDDPNASVGTRISTDPNQTPWFPAVASTGSEDNRYFCVWSANEGTVWSLIGRIYDPPPPPELDWLGTSNYIEDGVDPDSAFGGSPFTFKVKYFSDIEINAAPEIAQVWVDLDDNGNYEIEERFDMTGEGGSVTDYTAGRVYSYQNPKILYDGDGLLGYRFFFKDIYNTAIGDPTLDHVFQVDLDGNQPLLDWTEEPGFKEDGARPDGTEWGTDTSFEFRVIYQDGDNDAPQHMELWIDKNGDGTFDPNHEKLDMVADGSTYQQGQMYTKIVTLRSDMVRPVIYKFEADDGKNKAFGDPRFGSYLSFNPLGETAACLNTQYQFFPSITSTGSGYQVFWEDLRERELDANDRLVPRSHIWMELLSEDGQVKDGPGEPGQKRIDTASKGAFKPLAQFDPNTQKTLVVWEDLRDGNFRVPSEGDKNIFKPETIYEGLDIYGIFIGLDGEPLIDPNDPNSTGEFIIGGLDDPKNMLNPDMALGMNGQYLIVWESETVIDTTSRTEIFARFVRFPEGAYGNRKWIRINVEGRDFPGDGHQLMPRVAWNGDYYLAVWQDIAGVDIKTGYETSRIYGIRIDPNGKLHPPDPENAFKFFNDADIQDLSDPNINQLFPDVASDGEDFLIVWQDSRKLGTKRGYDIYGMRVNINGLAIKYLDPLHWEIPICTANGHQIRPRVFWDPQAGQYLIMWLEIPYELSPGDMLSHRMSYPFPRTGDIKVVRMDPNGLLIDGPSGKEDTYEGTSIIGVSATQDRPDMVCDPNMGCRLIWEDLRSRSSYDLYTTTFQSTLNWVDDPNFENSGVYPMAGGAGGNFTFKVEYRDRLDLPPLMDFQVWIDLNDNGTFEGNEKFDMNMEVVDPNVPVVSQGIIYSLIKKIELPQDPNSDGIIAYRFYFQNEKGQAKGLGSGLNFLSLIEAPQLDWTGEPGFTTDGVDPDQADSGTEFRFSVSYTDKSGALPINKQIWIDQDDNGEYGPYEKHPMEEDDTTDTDSSDGKVYNFTTTLFYRGDGIIKYRFFFDNGVVEAEGDPASDHTLTVNSTARDELWEIYSQDDGLAGNSVTSLAIDQNNIVWAGFTPSFEDPNAGGVSRFIGQTWQTFKGPAYLPNNSVRSLTISPNNHLWVGTYSGISRFDGQTWDTGIDPNNNFINMIVSGKDGHIWADIYSFADPNTFGDPNALGDPNASEFYGGGLARYDSSGWTFYKRGTMGADFMTALAIDANGIVWAGICDIKIDPNGRPEYDYKGIVLFDPNTEEVIKSFNSSEGDYPGGNLVYNIYIDESGDIWVGSVDTSQGEGMGLSHYNTEQKKWTKYINGENGVSLGSNVITAIDRKGDDLWLGHVPESETLIGGATYHNLSTGIWQVLNSNDSPLGDPFNFINDLAIDIEGSVWFATFNGIARYFLSETILTFTDSGFTNGVSPATGISGTEFEFRVQYQDEGNAPPDLAQVWIDLNDDGDFDDVNEKNNMSPLDPNDQYYIDGVVYFYTKSIEFVDGADLSYRFYFEKDGSPVLGTPAGDHTLTIESAGPYLDWAGGVGFDSDGVEPNQGESGDEFVFKVKYFSPENEPPDQGKTQVWIDKDADGIYESNEKFDMDPESLGDTDYTDGRIYRYSVNLNYAGEGRIKYRFYFVVDGSEVTGSPSNDHYLIIFREKVWVTYTTEQGLSSNIVTSLVLDDLGRIWAGTIYQFQVSNTTDPYYTNGEDTQPSVTVAPGGVNIYDGNNWTSYYEQDPNLFLFNAIICMTKDQNGNIWAGTPNGLIKYTSANPSQKVRYTAKNAVEWGDNLVTALTAGVGNDIWIGTHPKQIDPNKRILSGGGLTRFDGQNWTRYDPNVLGSNLVISLAVDKDEKVWMGLANLSIVQGTGQSEGQLVRQYTFQGLAILDPETEEITEYRANNTDFLDDDHIRAISIQESGDVWIATGMNLILQFIYSPDMSTFGMGLTYYSNGEWKQKYNSGNTPVNGGMPANNVTALFVHEESDIWMGILEDDPNFGGINHFDRSKEEWEWFTPGNVVGKLLSPHITDILVDNNEDVWAATMNGVARYGYGEISDEGVPLGPYRGLFNPYEETGCFIGRSGGNRKINNGTIIGFSIIMGLFLILIGYVCRRQIINHKRMSENKMSDRYGVLEDLEVK